MVHAACWTHARRGFANVLKLNPGDPVATPIVAEISKLFAVDAEAREQGLSVEARHRLRQQKAPELLQKIKADIEAAKLGALPGGALEGACEYALGLWPRLTCFLEYPELELSNNLAEDSMRPVRSILLATLPSHSSPAPTDGALFISTRSLGDAIAFNPRCLVDLHCP